MGLKLVTPPIMYPVTLVEAKRHLRVDYSDDDADIEMCIAAATAHIDGRDGWLQRALIDQTWDLCLDAFPCDAISIPLPPTLEIIGVYYLDENGVERTISSNDYRVDDKSRSSWVVIGETGWPAIQENVNAVRVRFRAGYVDTQTSPIFADMPAAIKKGLLLYIGTLYAHRETMIVGQMPVMMPWAAEALLNPYRIY